MTEGTNLSRPFHACVAFLEEAHRVLALSAKGISSLAKSADLVRALAELDHVDEDGNLTGDAQKHVDAAYQEAELAQNEVTNDFPLLHAQTVVALWSALESTFPRMAIEWLLSYPETLQRPVFSKIKAPVGSYELMSQEERVRFIVEELLQLIQFQHLPGIARFEALFDALGMGGSVDDDLRRNLYELSQVRNLVVHQFSIVDQRFADACPWMKVEVGERLRIGHRDYVRYYDAVMTYLTEVVRRVTNRRNRLHEESESSEESVRL